MELKKRIVDNYGMGPVTNRKRLMTSWHTWPRLYAHELREARAAGVVAEAQVVTIIPTIGRQSLRPAVESALAQTVTDHAVVVVSDGPHSLPSLPHEATVVRTSANCRVVGVVRNIGLRATRSLACAFLDDDNTWRPEHLANGLATLEHADLAYSSAARHRPDGSVFDSIGGPWDRTSMRHLNSVDASTIVIRRSPRLHFSRLSRVGDQFTEDWELTYRTSRRHRIVWTGETTVDYAIDEGFLTWMEEQQRRARRS